jgi:hypothetical protein
VFTIYIQMKSFTYILLQLKNDRLALLEAMGFNERVISLASENEAHSEDEFVVDATNSRGVVYHIKEKEGRSTKAKKFYRLLDLKRHQIALETGKTHYR